jgi:segregation and condensation protein A
MEKREEEYQWSEDTYKVKLQIFEGPLDLLLYLVKKNEYSIFDIPIAEITRQYMEHLELMKVLNLDIAGEYLVMASTLAHIKSKMLLPPAPEEEEDEGEDPRMELALKLLEYQRFKEVAEELSSFDILLRDVFLKGAKAQKDAGEDAFTDITVYELVWAFRKILLKAPKETIHEVALDELSIREKIMELSDIIVQKKEVVFEDLFPRDATRSIIVITFLALLELIRDRIIRIYQAEPFGTIRIYSAVEE